VPPTSHWSLAIVVEACGWRLLFTTRLFFSSFLPLSCTIPRFFLPLHSISSTLEQGKKHLADLVSSHHSYQEPSQRPIEVKAYDRNFNAVGRVGISAGGFDSAQLDRTERQIRDSTRNVGGIAENRFGVAQQDSRQEGPRYGGRAEEFPRRQAEVRIKERTSTTTVDPPKHKRDMGYYDDDGHYHSFRRGVARVAERIAHPIHGPSLIRHHHHHHSRPEEKTTIREDIVVRERDVPSAPAVAQHYSTTHNTSSGSGRCDPAMSSPNTITIPCHHIRIGDLLILQGRPCQVIRITTSAQTGQHRYLGVDLFTKQLHEESSFISNPSPSVIVQNMLGPVFKQYRVLDITEDCDIVAMTETGDIKQSLPILDQSSLASRLQEAFDSGRGSVRVLVLSDEGRELIVDYKVIHGSRL
jgi:hypothetical protein